MSKLLWIWIWIWYQHLDMSVISVLSFESKYTRVCMGTCACSSLSLSGILLLLLIPRFLGEKWGFAFRHGKSLKTFCAKVIITTARPLSGWEEREKENKFQTFNSCVYTLYNSRHTRWWRELISLHILFSDRRPKQSSTRLILPCQTERVLVTLARVSGVTTYKRAFYIRSRALPRRIERAK